MKFDRRSSDRRKGERRKSQIPVALERRKGGRRQDLERRKIFLGSNVVENFRTESSPLRKGPVDFIFRGKHGVVKLVREEQGS